MSRNECSRTYGKTDFIVDPNVVTYYVSFTNYQQLAYLLSFLLRLWLLPFLDRYCHGFDSTSCSNPNPFWASSGLNPGFSSRVTLLSYSQQ